MSHHSERIPPEMEAAMRGLSGRTLEEATQGLAEKLGATGEFPDGKLAEADEGQIRFAIAADKHNNVVHVDFGKPIQWLAMKPKQAADLGQLLCEKARELE